VTQRVKLWSNAELTRYIAEQSRRHFCDEGDRKDAMQDAWERLQKSPRGMSLAEYEKIAYRVINARYKREQRRHRREIRTST
jgi:hypothetical protein